MFLSLSRGPLVEQRKLRRVISPLTVNLTLPFLSLFLCICMCACVNLCAPHACVHPEATGHWINPWEPALQAFMSFLRIELLFAARIACAVNC